MFEEVRQEFAALAIMYDLRNEFTEDQDWYKYSANIDIKAVNVVGQDLEFTIDTFYLKKTCGCIVMDISHGWKSLWAICKQKSCSYTHDLASPEHLRSLEILQILPPKYSIYDKLSGDTLFTDTPIG